jgi:hypothetical protein
VVEVEDTIRAACRRRRVLEAAADHYRWARSLELLDAEGIPVGEFPQSPVRMAPATTRFYAAVVDRLLTTTGRRGWCATSPTRWSKRTHAAPGWPRNTRTLSDGSTRRDGP